MSQSYDKDFYDACAKGDLAAVKRMAESGKANLNAFSPVGMFDSEVGL